MLVAASLLVLPGCVTATKPIAAAGATASSDTPSEQQTADAAVPSTPSRNKAYRDPLVRNVSADAASRPNTQAAASAPSPLPGSATGAPANIGGLALQPTAINAHTLSIYSVPNSAMPAQPAAGDATAYAPGPGISPARASVFSAPATPSAPPQSQSDADVTTPDQTLQKRIPQSRSQAETQPATMRSASLQGATRNVLYSAPRVPAANGLLNLLHKVALPGLTRTAPNGLHVQNDTIQVGCFQPDLVRMIKSAENHFGRPVVVTSGYRDPSHNRLVGGADESLHKSCDAADLKVEGVSKWELASYLRSLPGRGGVGTYCHTESVHLDTGSQRDWNWACRGPGASETAEQGI
ncbi:MULTISPECIES: D-Ala-D-Ala carboxypeptidase family metallohydrolase [unclassified Sinorhizobium]|uniref:YcbK family protein n=1 Tax=unclassified Sinorhizobium TaxID=2613772 RepID=UPI0035256387